MSEPVSGSVSYRVKGSPDAETALQEIGRLIDALASKNKAPIQRGRKGDLELEYPEDYDEKADELVNSAGDKLIARGTVAFPLLIEHCLPVGGV